MLAALYRELGFDPGGRWHPSARAGFEADDVRTVNLAVADELGLSIKRRRGGRVVQTVDRAATSAGRMLPGRLRPSLQRAVDVVRYQRATPDLMQWNRLGTVAAHHGDELRALAKERQVVKDPRFCFTLRVWLASGVPVEHVVLTIRPLDAMAESRVRVGMYPARAKDWGKHNYCYGLGLLLTATAEYRVPLVVLRFPDFLERPDALHRSLPFPAPVTEDAFAEAFTRVYDPALVHDER
jgi:hypothetical protein